MPIRLNITIDKDVHERLKRELPAKGISRFGLGCARLAKRWTTRTEQPRGSGGGNLKLASGTPPTSKVGRNESRAPPR